MVNINWLLFRLGVTLFFQKFHDLFLEFSLYEQFAIFGTSAHSAFGLKQFAKFFEVGICTDKAADDGHTLSATMVLLNAHTQFLIVYLEVLISLINLFQLVN